MSLAGSLSIIAIPVVALKTSGVDSQRPKTIEFLHHNMFWSGCFFCECGLAGCGSACLSHLRSLRLQQLLVGVVLFLPADIDLIS